MTPSFRLVPVASCLLCLCAACQRTPDTESVAPPAQTASPTDAPAPAPGSTPRATPGPTDGSAGTAYACTDGTRMRVAFGGHEATLQWADGRSLVLPRAESASKGGGDVYVGDTVSLQRDGTRLQLHDGDRAATGCEPEAGTAAG